ncbi:MAG: GTPase Era [Gammaproteobacteria bacterium]|nr:GTPase Era [Gammaproteobacteria bacterium]|tara:strand:- start:2591 stop:3463 length:873 start_codon:yes stop_codon:yes gene_type:complete
MTKENKKTGYVAVLGRPNVGKSTLVNSLVGEKISIVTSKPQTTQINVLGIVHNKESQIIFVDTPGLVSEKQMKFNSKALNREAVNALSQADLVLMMVEANVWKKTDDYIFNHLKEMNMQGILVVNKVDRYKDKNKILDFLKDRSENDVFIDTVPISALYEKNLIRLIEVIERHLPVKSPEFDKDTVTDKDTFFRITEILRERLMHHLRDELPYSLDCSIDNFEDKEKIVMIDLLIKTKKDAHKKIIIGKGGGLLKQVGTEARKEIETLVGKKVFLTTQVRSIKKGQNRAL